MQQFSLSSQRFKAAATRFPSSTEQQKKANGTQTQGGSQAITTILADTYSTMMEYGLVDSICQ